MNDNLNRRDWLEQSVAATAAAALLGATPCLFPNQLSAETVAGPTDRLPRKPRLRYCLNTSTIRGQKLPLPEEIKKVAAAGYDAIEPWMGEIDEFVKGGGKLTDLRKQIEDAGITVESAIGFANWIVDDPEKRRQGLEQLKQDMDRLQALGGKRIAAPPAGATDHVLSLPSIVDRYREILLLGDKTGVIPQLELWGFSKTLSRLGELMYVSVETGHPHACLLLDVYHIYKGGSDFRGLDLISGSGVHVLHMNDYPDMDRAKIGDADRVYPGDGVGPVTDILTTLVRNGFEGVLSLELFNRQYWEQDVDLVLARGLRTMQGAVERARVT